MVEGSFDYDGMMVCVEQGRVVKLSEQSRASSVCIAVAFVGLKRSGKA